MMEEVVDHPSKTKPAFEKAFALRVTVAPRATVCGAMVPDPPFASNVMENELFAVGVGDGLFVVRSGEGLFTVGSDDDG
jgi:hypothetical protein